MRYVGRSEHHDQGLNARLHEHDGTKKDCTHFKFDHFGTVKEAFEKESTIFHDFKLSKTGYNTNHPARPVGENHPCPVSRTCFDGNQEGDDD